MDKYDRQIAELERLEGDDFRKEVHEQWKASRGLFAFAAPHNEMRTPKGDCCGCLTMIRHNPMFSAYTQKLTREIRNDERLPMGVPSITKENLPTLAEWQRRLDKELCRT